MQALGAQVIDYKTWYDCCGFGFRHIISEREFTRSFAIDRKIRVAVEEALLGEAEGVLRGGELAVAEGGSRFEVCEAVDGCK